MMNLKYLVTGTGRCGTVYMARFLTSVGILCGHETVFDYCGIRGAKRRLSGEDDLRLSIVSSLGFDTDKNEHVPQWHPDVKNIVADSSYMAAPYLAEELLKETKVIHVVRNPIKVINSFCNNIYYFRNGESVWKENQTYENFIYKFLPELKIDMPQYDRASLYYVRWNEMIERSNPDFFFRVEDSPDGLLKFLGVADNVDYYKEKTANTFKSYNEDVFDSLMKIQNRNIRLEVANMARRYGYNVLNDAVV